MQEFVPVEKVIRDLISIAKSHNIDINSITVSPDQYDTLASNFMKANRVVETNFSGLWSFHGIVINKRKCQGCCVHEVL